MAQVVRRSLLVRGDGHRSLVTPERVLSEYNEDLIFFDLRLSFTKNRSFYFTF